MYDFIPSEWMRKYLKEQGREFSDKKKAALIWNEPNHMLSERPEALWELARGSSDGELKKQIKERVEYEAAALKALKENPDGRFVYVVEDNSEPYVFFADFDAAAEAERECEKYGCEFHIEKHSIVLKDNHGEKFGLSYAGRACVIFSRAVEISDVYSSEISSEKLRKIMPNKMLCIFAGFDGFTYYTNAVGMYNCKFLKRSHQSKQS